jgi:riboflavin synthase
MFTGAVAEIGAVRHTAPKASGLRLEIASSHVAQDLGIDANVNVAGVCLTVVERDTHGFAVDVVTETLSRTTLGRAIRGTRVNLEPAATPTTALGGQFVQGQVDATTKLVGRREQGGGAERLRFAVPKGLARYIVVGGSSHSTAFRSRSRPSARPSSRSRLSPTPSRARHWERSRRATSSTSRRTCSRNTSNVS